MGFGLSWLSSCFTLGISREKWLRQGKTGIFMIKYWKEKSFYIYKAIPTFTHMSRIQGFAAIFVFGFLLWQAVQAPLHRYTPSLLVRGGKESWVKAIADPSLRLKVAKYAPLITAAASRHGLSEVFIAAVIRQESNFNANARSHCGATGLMQLMPSTAKALGVRDATDPAQNIEGGSRYLRQLLARFEGNVDKALAAYNSGMARVIRHGGVPPIPETQAYVKKVKQYAKDFHAQTPEPTRSVF